MIMFSFHNLKVSSDASDVSLMRIAVDNSLVGFLIDWTIFAFEVDQQSEISQKWYYYRQLNDDRMTIIDSQSTSLK